METTKDSDLDSMSVEELKAEVLKLRVGIRQHRDASGHNLCWYVPELWNLLPEKVEPKPEVPPVGGIFGLLSNLSDLSFNSKNSKMFAAGMYRKVRFPF